MGPTDRNLLEFKVEIFGLFSEEYRCRYRSSLKSTYLCFKSCQLLPVNSCIKYVYTLQNTMFNTIKAQNLEPKQFYRSICFIKYLTLVLAIAFQEESK